MKFQIGQKIYYRGDMANHEGNFEITTFKADKWGKHYDMKEINGEREIKAIAEHMISEKDTGNGMTRFCTKEARDEFKRQAYENLMARMKK